MKNEKGVLITGKDGVVKDGSYLESIKIDYSNPINLIKLILQYT
ncbi:hypothetical protein [Flavobacterium sp. UBA4197]|nr:hypothetical protein [Flavobacterium sp. UBA4197]